MSEQDVEDADGPSGDTAEGVATETEAVTLSEELADILPGEHVGGEEGDRTLDADASESLIERVETLETQLEEREETIEDLESRLKRKQAEFQNYKKRQKERMAEEKQRATEDLVERLLDVRDNLARALDQDESADIRDGVETTLRQFDEQFERENVERLDPRPGEDVDPQRHEALATIESDEPEDTIAEVHRPGYEMAGKVIRPAQVVVSDGSGDGEDADGAPETDEDGPGESDDEASEAS